MSPLAKDAAGGAGAPSPLREPAYRRLFAAQVTSLVGTGLTTVALALLAHELAGGNAGAVLGTVLALKMVVYVVVAPVVGSVAHRVPRKRFLIALDVVRAGIVFALPFVNALWQIYVLVALLNVAAAGFTPTFQASIPDVLPDEARYTRALSLARLAYDLENLVSPSLAAVALTFISYDRLFMLDALTFLVSAGLVARATIPAAAAPERSTGLVAQLSFGLRSYLATPRLRGLFALRFAAAAAGAMVIVNTVVYVRERLGLGETQVAWAMAATGGGSMLVALLTPRVLHRWTEHRLMIGGAGLLGILLSLGALTHPTFAGLLVLWGGIGMGMSAIATPAGRLVRRSCQPGDRPAFFSADFALSHAAWLLAYPVAGLVGASAGMEASLGALGGIALTGTAVALWLWPPREPGPLAHTHAAVTHEHLHIHDAHHEHHHEGWEGPPPHAHPHVHAPQTHRHEVTVDLHHPRWPSAAEEPD
jgi:MFS family permease